MEVIGVPFDLCGQRLGSRLGPAAVRLAGLHEALEAIGCPFFDSGDVVIQEEPDDDGGLRNFKPALDCLRKTKARVIHSLLENRAPLVIGGDHFIATGAISGALSETGPDMCVLWIDAHADMNTPETSPSGNLHGMPVSALMGRPSGVGGLRDTQWSQLLSEIVSPHKLQPKNAAWFGLRDVDPGEQKAIHEAKGSFISTMYEIDRYGVVECLLRFDAWMRSNGSNALWISFDVDALDPFLAPGTGTAVRGGLTYREMHLLGEMLWELLNAPGCPYRLIGLDLVETNPLSDNNNVTAKTAVEWIASLFGKTILGPRT